MVYKIHVVHMVQVIHITNLLDLVSIFIVHLPHLVCATTTAQKHLISGKSTVSPFCICNLHRCNSCHMGKSFYKNMLLLNSIL